jgi:hypothetical protein
MLLQNMSIVFVLLYMKQAPCASFERFVYVIKASGFSPSAHDSTFFIHLSPRGHTLLLLYVDDMFR